MILLEALTTAHDKKYIIEQQLIEQRALHNNRKKVVNTYEALLKSSFSPTK